MHFTWDAKHQSCFQNIKALVSQTFSYYNRAKPVTLQKDYSEDGHGVVLVQEGKLICFASKSLSDGEVDYAPIECHHYLY